MGLLLYPYFLVVFWYRDFFSGSIRLSLEIFSYTANLLSVPLLLKTFFKPLKNEYREGLVLFSRVMGMFIKSLILMVTIPILMLLTLAFFVINWLVILLPILIFWFLLYP